MVDGVGGRCVSTWLLLLLFGGGRESGVVVVGAGLMCWDISSLTEAGVTLSIKVKEGSSRTVVGAEAEWSCCGFGGMGMLDAESISFCVCSLLVYRLCLDSKNTGVRRGVRVKSDKIDKISKPMAPTPLVITSGPNLPTASITLPFSSTISLTQSVLPVAIRICVPHPLTWPYSSSFSSMRNVHGYLMLQLLQSLLQSSPSMDGSTGGKRADGVGDFLKLLGCG